MSLPTTAVRLRVNGEVHDVELDVRATVLDTLRNTLDLTGAKKGCDHGQCGACTVLLDGQRVRSGAVRRHPRQHPALAGVQQPPTKLPRAWWILEGGSHIAYGVTVDIVIRVLDRIGR